MSLADREYLQINQALFSLAHSYGARMLRESEYAKTGLSLSDRSVVMVMGQFEPLNSRRLSQLMDLNPGTISQYVQRLVEKGLVRKEQDLSDRRNWWLRLTEAGTETYSQTILGTVLYTRDFLSTLDENEQRRLHELLLKASRSLGFDWQ